MRLPVAAKTALVSGRRDRRGSGLADASGRLGAVYDVNLDRRHLVDAQHAVVAEVALLDAAILQRDLLHTAPP